MLCCCCCSGQLGFTKHNSNTSRVYNGTICNISRKIGKHPESGRSSRGSKLLITINIGLIDGITIDGILDILFYWGYCSELLTAIQGRRTPFRATASIRMQGTTSAKCSSKLLAADIDSVKPAARKN